MLAGMIGDQPADTDDVNLHRRAKLILILACMVALRGSFRKYGVP